MAWPNNLTEVTCRNFPQAYLPAIVAAIENNDITWGKSTIVGAGGLALFKWAGAEWSFTEMFELVTSVTLLSGSPNHESLTISVLQGTEINSTGLQ
jgi:hypothetical protein